MTVLRCCIGITVLLLVGILILLRQLNRRGSMPSGKIIYDDLGGRSLDQRTLLSEKYGLCGRPDMILQRGRELIPVEIKNMRAPVAPYEGHVGQLMAYCLLTECEYGKKPKRGLLKYRDKTYEIAYTSKQRKNLISTLKKIRETDFNQNIHRSHEDERRCRFCGFRDVCAENLCPENER